MVQKAKSMYRRAQRIRKASHNASAEFCANVTLTVRPLKKAHISLDMRFLLVAERLLLMVRLRISFARSRLLVHQCCAFTVLLLMRRRVFLLAKNLF